MTKKILIATGGTGGHIFPAYSLANYLIRKKYNVKLTSDYRGLKYLKNIKNLNTWLLVWYKTSPPSVEYIDKELTNPRIIKQNNKI